MPFERCAFRRRHFASANRRGNLCRKQRPGVAFGIMFARVCSSLNRANDHLSFVERLLFGVHYDDATVPVFARNVGLIKRPPRRRSSSAAGVVTRGRECGFARRTRRPDDFLVGRMGGRDKKKNRRLGRCLHGVSDSVNCVRKLAESAEKKNRGSSTHFGCNPLRKQCNIESK